MSHTISSPEAHPGIAALVWLKLRGLIARFGGRRVKRYLWDSEFSSGRWDCLDDMAGDCLYPILERHANGGAILDLGCGPGSTGNELAPGAYSRYTGVDISEVAVAKARARALQCRRGDSAEYFQSDVYSYVPARKYDAIVFADSLNYFPTPSIPRMLDRYARFLNPNGVFVMRLKGVRPEWFDPSAAPSAERGQWARRKAIVALILNRFEILERELFHFDYVICVLVFRPRPR